MTKNRAEILAGLALVAALAVIEKTRAVEPDMPDEENRALAAYLIAPVFDMLDCTDQGFIESAEVDEHFPLLFNHYDRNLDSSLTPEEFAGSGDGDEAVLRRRMFAGMDGNGNDRVSPREYRDGIIALIRASDSDGDGEVTMAELIGAGAPDEAGEAPEEAE